MPTLLDVIQKLVTNVVDLTEIFADLALSNPVSTVLLLTGGLLTLFSIAFVGALAVGAVFGAAGDLISSGGAPPRRGR